MNVITDELHDSKPDAILKDLPTAAYTNTGIQVHEFWQLQPVLAKLSKKGRARVQEWSDS